MTDHFESDLKILFKIGGAASLLAMTANILDVVLGFGSTDVVAYGVKTSLDWFALFGKSAFQGLYALGILNIVYQACMIPVYFALVAAHRRKKAIYAALAMAVFFMGMAIYLANNAAIPMSVLSAKYAAAGTEAQRASIAAAGEAVLARGEDFTPGSFLGLILQGIAAIAISIIMLRGGIFKKATAWVGIVGFSFLAAFIVLATFVPSLYKPAYYGFGMTGGLFALVWFVLVARRLFRLGKAA